MTTRTTSHLSIGPIDRALLWLRWHRARLLYALVAIGWLLVALGARSLVQRPPVTPGAIVATPALPVLIIATAAPLPPTPEPVQQIAARPAANVTTRAIGVFGAPDVASYIGSVEAGRAFAPLARYGADWIQVDMDGSGVVYVRTADLYGVPELADMQPPPAPVVVYVAASQAAPTMAPYHEAPTMAPQTAAILDRNAWAAQAQEQRGKP